MRVRWPFIVALVAAVLIGVALTTVWMHRDRPQQTPTASSASSAARGRIERTTPVVEVAPGPIPTTRPMIGREGKTDDGYPLENVDAAGLRSLMWHARWDDLD